MDTQWTEKCKDIFFQKYLHDIQHICMSSTYECYIRSNKIGGIHSSLLHLYKVPFDFFFKSTEMDSYVEMIYVRRY